MVIEDPSRQHHRLLAREVGAGEGSSLIAMAERLWRGLSPLVRGSLDSHICFWSSKDADQPHFSQDMPVVSNSYKSHSGMFFMVAAYAWSCIRLEFCGNIQRRSAGCITNLTSKQIPRSHRSKQEFGAGEVAENSGFPHRAILLLSLQTRKAREASQGDALVEHNVQGSRCRRWGREKPRKAGTFTGGF